jgi:predicted phage baseplate assembly protein
VRWRQVATFVDEDGDARVYRLDPAAGEVLFGNGRCGKIPPANRDSIRAFSYQWGGGSAGNVPARAIANLSSALESVELAMNPVDAAGGADAPPADRLAVTAPALLRHADRALTPMDVEAIATGLAPDIVRARCLPREGCSIGIAVAIRDAGSPRPVPSRERREGIARNILAAGWGALAPESVTVIAPRYVSARVAVEVIATSAEAVAGVEQTIHAALTKFLHPVEGGPDGLGWPFGRRIWPSSLQRAIAGIAGLDRVVAASIDAITPGESLAALPPDGLIHVDDNDLKVVVRSPEDGR